MQPSLRTTELEAAALASGLPSEDLRMSRVTVFAKDEADSIEVSGYSSALVGFALLPYVIYTLYTAFGISFQGAVFSPGPYGLQYVAAAVNFGLVLWSLGSFLQRGRGLPAGPLGLFGLAEGLSYLAGILLVGSVVVSGVRGASGPGGPQLKLPTPADIQLPEFKAPEFKAPEFKAPEFKTPDFKAPEFKTPDFKTPDFKVPDFKAPDFKAPEVPKFEVPKLPEISLPKPLPKPDKKKVEEAPPAKEEEAEKPSTAKKILENIEDLFD